MKQNKKPANKSVLSDLNPGFSSGKARIVKWLIYISLLILVVDLIYKTVFGISYQNRESCILYNVLPRMAFLFYEYFIELFLVVIAGVFGAVILEKYFTRFKKFYPDNQLTAFIYASIIPVCSCSAIPMIETMREKIRFRAIITFVVAAPLLNPYIIVLSFSVLGWRYAVLRIILSLILAISAGRLLESIGKTRFGEYLNCKPSHGCGFGRKDIYYNTYSIMKKIFPYLLIAGALGMAIEFYDPSKILNNHYLGNNWWGVPIAISIGMPVYFCNGADIVFLQPLIKYAGLSLGTALSFSLTSTAICISSFVMLWKFMGKKLTIILSLFIILFTYTLRVIILTNKGWISIITVLYFFNNSGYHL